MWKKATQHPHTSDSTKTWKISVSKFQIQKDVVFWNEENEKQLKPQYFGLLELPESLKDI